MPGCLDAWMIDALFVTKNGLMHEQYWNIPPTSAQHGHFTREMVINSHIYIYISLIIQIHFDKGYIPCWSLRAHEKVYRSNRSLVKEDQVRVVVGNEVHLDSTRSCGWAEMVDSECFPGEFTLW